MQGFASDSNVSFSSGTQSPQESSSFFDIRIRPISALQATPGAEFSFAITPRFEIGPTIHYFNKTNDFVDTTLETFELGIKGTYLVWQAAHHEGVYVSGAFYDYINDVGNYSIHPNYSSGNFSTLGYTLTAGYQWDLGIFHSDAWTLRLGGGVGYGQAHFESVVTQGKKAPITTNVGVLSQLEPTLEFTLGFWI